MNVRHAAAFALVGWYLLVPLRENENSAKLRYDAPLGEWVYVTPITGFYAGSERSGEKKPVGLMGLS